MRYHIHIFCLLSYIFIHSYQVRSGPLAPHHANDAISRFTNPAASASRKVHVFTEFHLGKTAISRKSGQPVYGGHTQLWIDGTSTEGPLLIELGFNPRNWPHVDPEAALYAVRTKDLGVAKTGEPFAPHHYPGTLYFAPRLQGETFLSNARIFDHRAGIGLVADAWMQNPVYRMGQGSMTNTCYDLVERILWRMNLHLDPMTKALYRNSTEYYTLYSGPRNMRIPDVASMLVEPMASWTRVETRVFDVDYKENPEAPTLVYETANVYPSNVALEVMVNQLQLEAIGSGDVGII